MTDALIPATPSGTTTLQGQQDLEEVVDLADILHSEDARPCTVETESEASFIRAEKRSLEIFEREVRR